MYEKRALYIGALIKVTSDQDNYLLHFIYMF